MTDPSDESAYDEDAELARYIINHYPHLMTPAEARAHRAALLEGKATLVQSERIAATLRRESGLQTDPEIAAALEEGVTAFRSRVVARVLRDLPGQVFLNRCSECGRLVRTPKAQQCLWCGHDWHPRHL